MARISTYPLDLNISRDDLLIGTDEQGGNITKNFSVGGIADFIIGGGTANTLSMFSTSGLIDSPISSTITGSGTNIIKASNVDRFVIDKPSGVTSGDPEYLISQDDVWKASFGWDDDGAGFGYLYNWAGNGWRFGAAGNNPELTIVTTAGQEGVTIANNLSVEGNASITGTLADSSANTGTAGQVLSSTVTGTAWVNPAVGGDATLVVIACKNTSGTTITKGTPVYQTGTVGATATIEIAPADALISANKLPAIGLLQTDLNNNGSGNVVITGELLSIITSPIDGVTPTTGDKVFLKSGGGLTLTKPTGSENGIQNLGLIGKVSTGTAGTITVSSIMRTNDVPNLPEGRIWVGDGNTIVSDIVYIDEPNAKLEVTGNVLIQTATDVDNLKIVSTNTSLLGAPDIVLLADVPAVTGDSHGDILFQGQNGMAPGPGTVLTYTGLFSKMVDKDNNHSSLVMTTHKGNGAGAQALTATFSAKGPNNAATGTLLINPSSVTEVADYNLDVKGDARITGALVDSSGDAGTAGQVLSSAVTGTAWVDSQAANMGIVTSNLYATWTGLVKPYFNFTNGNTVTVPYDTININTNINGDVPYTYVNTSNISSSFTILETGNYKISINAHFYDQFGDIDVTGGVFNTTGNLIVGLIDQKDITGNTDSNWFGQNVVNITAGTSINIRLTFSGGSGQSPFPSATGLLYNSILIERLN